MGQANLAQGLEFQALVCEVEKVSVPVGLGEGYSSPSLPVWQASSPSPPCALLLPCRGSGSASKEEGEPEAGDRASLAEAAGANEPPVSSYSSH